MILHVKELVEMTKQIITVLLGIALVLSGLFAGKVKKNSLNNKRYDYVYLFGGLLIIVIGLFILK